jgi:hypothetical protein
MILGIAVVLVAVTVPLLGGSLARLADLRLRRVWCIGASLGLQVLIISIIPDGIPGWLGGALYAVSYGLAALFLWANRGVPWLWLVAVGGFANLLAIGANGGVMPASPGALTAAGRALHARGYRNSSDVAGAHLRFLGDIFALPRQWPLANVFSIGDVLLVLGATLLLHTVGQSRPARWPRGGRDQDHGVRDHGAGPAAAPTSSAT